jgi:hypothetical protein
LAYAILIPFIAAGLKTGKSDKDINPSLRQTSVGVFLKPMESLGKLYKGKTVLMRATRKFRRSAGELSRI